MVPNITPTKPLLRRATLSGTIRKADDAQLDALPPSKRVTFSTHVQEKVMEEFQAKGRSLEAVRLDVKRSIAGHLKGDSSGYDVIKAIFSPRKDDDNEDDFNDKSIDLKTYLIALADYAPSLNKGCSGLVKAVLQSEWLGRDEVFVKAYVHFLGSLASVQGAYVALVLGMLVDQFYGGTTSG